MVPHNSDSTHQQQFEKELIGQCACRLSAALISKELTLKSGTKVQIDGFNEKNRILCEAFARIGNMKPGQKRKLGSDILKLIFVERTLGGQWRKIICVSADSHAEKYLKGHSWIGQIVREFDFIVDVSFLSAEWKERILDAEKRQSHSIKTS
jgi:hypothetical protein